MTNCFIETEITLYHYTSNEGAKKIVESGYIQQSIINQNGTDVVYGEGVYMTSLDTTNTPVNIAENNYDAGYLPALEQGKIEKAIKITIARSKVEECATNSKRIVFRHPGNLYLKDVVYTVIDMPAKPALAVIS